MQTVKIFFKKKKSDKTEYLWAWKESADKKVFGVATTIEEITKRAQRMFPTKKIVLLPL